MTPETRAALALVQAGVPAEAIDRTLPLLNIETSDDDETLAVKIEELRRELPGVFDPSLVVDNAARAVLSARRQAELTRRAIEVGTREAAEDLGPAIRDLGGLGRPW